LAAELMTSALKLPPGANRINIIRKINQFRDQIAELRTVAPMGAQR
jgi:hypothetical protein